MPSHGKARARALAEPVKVGAFPVYEVSWPEIGKSGPACFRWRTVRLADLKAAGMPPKGIGDVVRYAEACGYRCRGGWAFIPWCRPAAAWGGWPACPPKDEPVPASALVIMALISVGAGGLEWVLVADESEEVWVDD